MPQAKRGTTGSSGSGSSSRSTRTRATSSASKPKAKTATKKSPAKSASAKSGSASTRARRSGSSTASRSASTARSTAAKGGAAAEARIDAIANRVRKLNETIIEAGREAGETTLSTYEKALKSIAGGIEKGASRSEIEWISNLATAQAKFIRDATNSLASSARDKLKP